MPTMTRGEHMAWCKERALEYLDESPPDTSQAIASMMSDLGKHPETTNHIGIGLAFTLRNGDVHGVRKWIEGFN